MSKSSQQRNVFKRQDAVDLEILNSEKGSKKGELRIKPSAILWKSPKAQKYFRIKIDDFIKYVESLDDKVTK